MRPFEAGSRGTLGRRFRAEKGEPRAGGTGRYKGDRVKLCYFYKKNTLFVIEKDVTVFGNDVALTS